MSTDLSVRHLAGSDRTVGQSFALVVVSAALLIAAGCGASTNTMKRGSGGPVAASVRATIAVGTAPRAVAVDSTNNKIYVADFGTRPAGSPACATGADVMVIDGTTESTAEAGFPVPLPSFNPFSVAFNPVSETVDVSVDNACDYRGPHGVLSIDPSNPATAGLIYQFWGRNSAAAGVIAVDQKSGDLFLGRGISDEGFSSGYITVLGDTGTIVETEIPVGSLSLGITLNGNTNTIYAGTSGTYGFGRPSISVVDGTTYTVSATITDPNGAGSIVVAVNPQTNTIYAANEQSSNVTVIDGVSNKVTATIAVGNSPTSIAVNPETNFIYVANSGFQHQNDRGSVTVIDGKTNATYTLTDSNALFPCGVAVNPATNRIYIANAGSNNVTIIDGAHE